MVAAARKATACGGTTRHVRRRPRRPRRRRTARVIGGAAAQTPDRAPSGLLYRPAPEHALGAGYEGPIAPIDLDAPAGTGGHGHASIDELDRPMILLRGVLTPGLPAVRPFLKPCARTHPRQKRLPSCPLLGTRRPSDASRPSPPACEGILAVVALVVWAARLRSFTARPPIARPVP